MDSQREILPGHLYDYPVYYDLVYGSDWQAEYAFLRACFQRYLPSDSSAGPLRIFEPACGTGRLLHHLGKAGYLVSGLDLSEAAVQYCNRRLAALGEGHGVWVGDMSSFRLPQPVDAAFNMINSFRHLLTEKAALAHLQCMAEAIRPGGVYVLGLHLTPLAGQPIERESWSARRGHLAVTTTLWTIERDLRRRRERCGMHLNVYTPTKWSELTEEFCFRTYTAKQFQRLLAKEPRLKIEEIYDFSYRIDEPIEIEPETEDVVLVLRRL